VIHVRIDVEVPEFSGVEWVKDKHTPAKMLQFEV
jgi:hypothetical protein